VAYRPVKKSTRRNRIARIGLLTHLSIWIHRPVTIST
jgi:hypothetical protein